MKVLVCGGRNYKDKNKVFDTLDRLHNQRPIEMIVHGGAGGYDERSEPYGADQIAEEWAALNKIPTSVYNADWKNEGRSAGPKRNARMLQQELPHGVVAFPGGPGTKNMIELAEKAGVPVKKIQ